MRRMRFGRTIQVLAALVLVASAFVFLRARRVSTAAEASHFSPDPEKHAEAYRERLQETQRILQSGYFDPGSK
ncbi:MAG: hypothetical protein JSU73_01960 [candidate division WOR-3 bacterium]|nr:MAG: hypothetical protein JSU73_01960 [candidate division WOR-3 bacterium]